MKARSFLVSAAVLGSTNTGARAFNSSILRSLTHLVGGGSNPVSPAATPTSSTSTTRDGVKRHMWNSIFGGGKGSQGINYAELKGMASKEAAELATQGVVKDKSKDGYSIATFAGGCFWGLELAYQRVPGVIDTSVGYTQGKEGNPTYDYVCSGMSGHTEAVQVFYDPKEVTYEYLCKLLLTRINPTLKNQVGNDRGTC